MPTSGRRSILTMNILRTILHYQDSNSDKVYIVEVNQLTGPKPYMVMTTWGRRNALRLSSQVKDNYATQSEAMQVARKLVTDKTKGKGAYKLAMAGLKIPGLANHVETNVTHVISAAKNAGPKATSIELIVDPQLKRNIKV